MLILSYNVSWQSMIGSNPKWPLCNNFKDSDRKNVVCIKNIAQMIDLTNQNAGELDFVALQEASNHSILTKESNVLKMLKHEVHKSGLEEMVIYWNDNRFEFIKSYGGEFRKGRPWQLIVFKEIANSEQFIFINVHADHYKYNYLIKKLERILRKIDLKNYRIIIAGEFNTTLPSELMLGDVKLFTHELINTCCYPLFELSFDHVLDSKDKPLNVKSPEINVMASDHKPILVTLT